MTFRTNIYHNGYKIPVCIKFNSQAKQVILRVDPKNEIARITLPPLTSKSEGLSFARERVGWLVEQLTSLPPKKHLTSGYILPIMDRNLQIRHRPDLKVGVQLIGTELIVSGKPEHLERRVIDWLKKYAKEIISSKANEMARQLERRINRISIRDTKSRWGSCSAHGNLAFCWRLIMTPEAVLNYVVAHEVSHLVHMNHSQEFWDLVNTFNVNTKKSRTWLKRYGTALQRIG